MLLPGFGDCLFQQLAQAQAVGQAGQLVGIGHAPDGGLRLGGPEAGAQGGDAEAQVVGGGEQQFDFLLVEGVALRGHDHQLADQPVVDPQRQHDGRGKAVLAGLVFH
ncbi:hypothetical protein D3C71_1865110 [compost metagenome]